MSQFPERDQIPARRRPGAVALLGLLLAVLAVGYMAVMFVWAIIRMATPGNWS